MALQHNSLPGNSTQMVYSGPMSYNAASHGVPFPNSTPFPALLDPSTLPPEPTYYDISVATHKQIASLQAKLDQKLGPEYISQRPGPGGGPKLTYAEGWKIINLANQVFGFNGWSSNICSVSVDYLDPVDDGKRWNCGVSAVVRVTLSGGVYHEDIGYGVAENIKGKGTALDKCKKEAVTDGIKRTLRNFGNLLGNCLYDKQYTQEIVKVKVQPPKFNQDTLHRSPEFEQGNSRGSKPASASNSSSSNVNAGSTANVQKPLHPSNNTGNQSVKCKDEPPTPYISKTPANQIITHDTCQDTPTIRNTKHLQDSRAKHGNSTDQEDASYFNSEDDPYFMQLDMEVGGEVSLEEDRPIDPEAEYDDPHQIKLSMNRGATSLQQGKNENTRPHPGIEKTIQAQQPGLLRTPQLAPNLKQSEQPQHEINIHTVKSECQTSRTSNALGGFHFPSPMDSSRSGISATSHVTGVKRGLDAINDTSGNYRREAVVQNALRTHGKPADTGGRAREPLAPLMLNENNDVKRMRR
ncbi:hypothetical protein Clacol_009113 [Clathrus columnatus]|uniref:Uncharacterized protein n=1 Tax=Clathrus columnatus TaxID=1419009 RepID=A0AAV5ASH4_9AGAM|nr:hypothetical protein Clacol_009113 [Clathrus columnatus]